MEATIPVSKGLKHGSFDVFTWGFLFKKKVVFDAGWHCSHSRGDMFRLESGTSLNRT